MYFNMYFNTYDESLTLTYKLSESELDQLRSYLGAKDLTDESVRGGLDEVELALADLDSALSSIRYALDELGA